MFGLGLGDLVWIPAETNLYITKDKKTTNGVFNYPKPAYGLLLKIFHEENPNFVLIQVGFDFYFVEKTKISKLNT